MRDHDPSPFKSPSEERQPISEIRQLTDKLRDDDFQANFAHDIVAKTPEELVKLRNRIWRFANELSVKQHDKYASDSDFLLDAMFDPKKLSVFAAKLAALIGVANLSGAALLGAGATTPFERGKKRGEKQKHVQELLEFWEELRNLHSTVLRVLKERETRDGKKYGHDNDPEFPASPTLLGAFKDRFWDRPGM